MNTNIKLASTINYIQQASAVHRQHHSKQQRQLRFYESLTSNRTTHLAHLPAPRQRAQQRWKPKEKQVPTVLLRLSTTRRKNILYILWTTLGSQLCITHRWRRFACAPSTLDGLFVGCKQLWYTVFLGAMGPQVMLSDNPFPVLVLRGALLANRGLRNLPAAPGSRHGNNLVVRQRHSKGGQEPVPY
jgi:hypothetical protein